MNNKKLLELFCGTKSVGKVFEEDGYEVVSLDYNKKFNATHTEDFLLWDYKQYPADHFNVIWASPDCTTWSLASGGKHRNLNSINGFTDKANLGNQMILKLIDVLSYFKCKAWFIENPKGLLVHYPPLQEFIQKQDAHKTLVYYGNYNDWGFIKPTHIWSNLPLWTETQPVLSEDKYVIRKRNCDGRFKKYYKAFQRSPEERSRIPPDLIHRLRLLVETI